MIIQESGEMYLETILLLTTKNDFVRAVDISEAMGFSKPSISRALSLLRSEGYIEVHDNGRITLTQSGTVIAERIYERHMVLTKMLTSIGVSKEQASRDACKIEHDISDETFMAIKEHFSRKNI